MATGRGEIVRRPAMGFEAPPVTGEIQQKRDGEWTSVVIAEEKTGFVVKDRRRVK